jgi:glutamyl-tRNA reductase
VFGPERLGEALLAASDEVGLDEVVILSTCNRTEVYFSGHNEPGKVLQWMADFHHIPFEELETYHYFHRETDAIEHMMRVASGLDSMILGEPQILGQIKSAFAMADEHGTVSSELHQAFRQVFAVAKKVRTETAIGENPVSVAYAAVSLSKKIFADLTSSSALLIGAGKTIELVARHLQEQGVKDIMVANRTLSRAQSLAEKIDGRALLLSELPDVLPKADIVISSTASQLPILGKGAVETALKQRKHRPVFMLDIAVPRDIEPEVAELEDIYLYTVDDLREVIDEGRRSREQAAADAHRIISSGVDEYFRELRVQDAVSTIRSFREKIETIRDEEVEKARRALDKGDDPADVLQSLGRNLTNKLLHLPTRRIREASSEGRNEIIDVAHELFDLSGDQGSEQDK